MKILCVGDVVGAAGVAFVQKRLPYVRQMTGADFVVLNGENADKSGVGLSRDAAEALLPYADVITTGNHCYRRANEALYSENPRILHPANQPLTPNENGCCEIDTGRRGILRVLNLAGVAFMEPLDNPFLRADALLEQGTARYTVVDFHAESTAEKQAMGYHLDGRVSAVFGTHTHVQTADERILPGGTGYITDAGMTGPQNSVLGMEPETAVTKQRLHLPVHFRPAPGPCVLCAVLFDLDDDTGLCRGARRILQKEQDKPTGEPIL